MVKITLFCSVGASTSLLTAKMKEAAKKYNYECEVNAYSMAVADKYVSDSDIVLIGPQVRFELKGLQKKYPDKIIEPIDMRMYGTMDGEGVLKFVIKRLGN